MVTPSCFCLCFWLCLRLVSCLWVRFDWGLVMLFWCLFGWMFVCEFRYLWLLSWILIWVYILLFLFICLIVLMFDCVEFGELFWLCFNCWFNVVWFVGFICFWVVCTGCLLDLVWYVGFLFDLIVVWCLDWVWFCYGLGLRCKMVFGVFVALVLCVCWLLWSYLRLVFVLVWWCVCVCI